MNKIIPLDDYVLVELVPATERKSAGGIVIPLKASQHRDLLLGKVLAAGPGYTAAHGEVKVTVKVDDLVLFPRGGGDAVFTEDEKQLRMMRCCEIRAKVEESRILTAPEPGKIVLA